MHLFHPSHMFPVCAVSFKSFPMHAKIAAALPSCLLCVLTHLLKRVLKGRRCCLPVSQKEELTRVSLCVHTQTTEVA